MTTVRPAGPHGLLVECADTASATALFRHVQRRRAVGDLDVRDVIPGAETVLLDGVADRDAVARLAYSWAPSPEEYPEDREVTVEVRYDGPDLDQVAEELSMSVDALKALHMSSTFTAAFSGFMPGFAYMEGFPRPVRRHSEARTEVPAGAVGLAADYCGIYPRSTPGGWKLIATMVDPERLWDERHEPAALIYPGTRVRFEEVQ
ncbi:5-oxoprolinase subunit B family protein [Salininema proteolyticum]|uniref:Allophanate hydrolase subunit 1 n=1 Tax=Salininema proteolyticum TaxID=1607685 RepID=A0ABV8TW75_9ACTN